MQRYKKKRTNYNGICILMLIKVLPFVSITFKCYYNFYYFAQENSKVEKRVIR